MSEKLERNSFKKLLYLNTSRMLVVLGYVPTHIDEKKFIHSNYKQQIEREIKGEQLMTRELALSPIKQNNNGGLYEQ